MSRLGSTSARRNTARRIRAGRQDLNCAGPDLVLLTPVYSVAPPALSPVHSREQGCLRGHRIRAERICDAATFG
jgi:hypothetical protein